MDVFIVVKPTVNNIEFLEMKNQLIYLFKKININDFKIYKFLRKILQLSLFNFSSCAK